MHVTIFTWTRDHRTSAADFGLLSPRRFGYSGTALTRGLERGVKL